MEHVIEPQEHVYVDRGMQARIVVLMMVAVVHYTARIMVDATPDNASVIRDSLVHTVRSRIRVQMIVMMLDCVSAVNVHASLDSLVTIVSRRINQLAPTTVVQTASAPRVAVIAPWDSVARIVRPSISMHNHSVKLVQINAPIMERAVIIAVSVSRDIMATIANIKDVKVAVMRSMVTVSLANASANQDGVGRIVASKRNVHGIVQDMVHVSKANVHVSRIMMVKTAPS